MFWLELAVVLSAMFLGARLGGIFLGMAGGVGLAVLTFVFHLAPSSPPIDVMLIITAVVVAASTLQAAGGMDYLVHIAERILRKNPRHITFVAPFVAYAFTFLSGTGNVSYSIMPVIAEVARESGVRPERPMSISVIASQQAITASPISAATVTMVGLLSSFQISLLSLLSICVPATLLGVFAGAFYSNRMGKELNEDPEYLRRVQSGLVPPVGERKAEAYVPRAGAKLAVALFVLGAILVVSFGTFAELRPQILVSGKLIPMAMPHTIEITMLVISAIIVLFCRVDVTQIVAGSVFKAGMMGIVCIFGLAWMGDTLVANNMDFIKNSVQALVVSYPWVFAFALFFVATLTTSQAATTRALMPLGISLGMSVPALIGVWPAVNGYFFIPNYATLIAGVAFDRTGTTKIGKYVLNHSYMIPGLIATFVSVSTALFLGSLILK